VGNPLKQWLPSLALVLCWWVKLVTGWGCLGAIVYQCAVRLSVSDVTSCNDLGRYIVSGGGRLMSPTWPCLPLHHMVHFCRHHMVHFCLFFHHWSSKQPSHLVGPPLPDQGPFQLAMPQNLDWKLVNEWVWLESEMCLSEKLALCAIWRTATQENWNQVLFEVPQSWNDLY